MSVAADSVILLTGATGTVGRELLVRMARRPGTRVLCPVRAPDDAEARRRVSEVLDQMPYQRLTGEERQRIEAFHGDITRPRVGLDAARWDALAAEVARIVHGAASVRWSFS